MMRIQISGSPTAVETKAIRRAVAKLLKNELTESRQALELTPWQLADRAQAITSETNNRPELGLNPPAPS